MGISHKTHQNAKPNGIRFARAGSGMQQARLVLGNALPDLSLKFAGFPATQGEPIENSFVDSAGVCRGRGVGGGYKRWRRHLAMLLSRVALGDLPQ